MTTKFPDDANDGDGSWFLEAVGATPPTPTGAESLAELTKENEVVLRPAAADLPESEPQQSPDSDADTARSKAPQDTATVALRTTQITTSSFDGDPGTTNATYDRSARSSKRQTTTRPIVPPPPPPPPPAPTATAVIPEPPVSAPVESNQVDAELARPLRSKRSFRWPIVVVLVLLIAAVAAAAIWLPQATESEALSVRQSYYDTTAAVRNHLPATQTALDAITTIDSSPESLTASIPIIATLDGLAFDMEAAAAEPLPSVLPLVPKGAIDALEPLQQQTALLGVEGTQMASRLGNSYIYRTTIPTLMDVGNLPTSASTETINTISVTLATSLSKDAATVAALPADVTFDVVREEAVASHARYTDWQSEYLAALTSENTELALTLVTELDGMRVSLNASNAAALGAFRTEVDLWIVTYAGQLEAHMAALTQS
ncbi:MAG: hypothetical protein DWP92_03470 [Armatimonadetes bacterium]|nr:MAG: hypothetical protein DWP92_03470 [Armatimonadota bacterium]